ncbi:MAG: hypothetical protein JWM24_1047 [Solirubrobacterales bacterium]|jgi:hypothetical protein|nr:hypothetical protein [Solirubrobacterales bacterium]
MNTRRRLVLSLLAALLVTGLAAGTALAGRAHVSKKTGLGSLPEKAMDSALQIQGSKGNGVLQFSFDRTDITNVKLRGVPIKPPFELNGDMDFQPLGHGQAFLNGDLPVQSADMDRTISAIVRNGLAFQAEHQHFYDFRPIVWFIHIRARGNALDLARKVHSVLKAAGTPLPQSSPSNPKTPFDAARLKQILHGYDAQVSDDGVVTVFVARRSPIHINGVRVKPAANIATNIAFEPLNSSGTDAAVAPDFGMVASEVDRVVATMQGLGWDIGCLYNQETAENPQLYFSHQFKTGDPYALAQEVRDGLNRMNSQ